MNAEGGVSPAEQCPDQRLVNPSFPLERLYSPAMEDLLQVPQAQPGARLEETHSVDQATDSGKGSKTPRSINWVAKYRSDSKSTEPPRAL